MISLEGKTFNILKSLPVAPSKILLAKILTSNIISMPVILTCDSVFFIICNNTIVDIIYILTASLIMPTFIAILGLIINLKYPKMNSLSDTEVVKQSMSSAISVFAGMFTGMLSIGLAIWGAKYNMDLVIGLELLAFLIADIVLWQRLKKWGVKKFKEINV